MNLKVADAKREEGFTLIELLVVVIIIGILAAIAIPIFLNQREKARDSAVESTLRSAATYMEIYYTEEVDTYTDDPDHLVEQGFRSGSNVNIDTIELDGDMEFYCIQAHHTGDDTRIWVLTTDPGDTNSGAPRLSDGCNTNGTAQAVT